MGRPKTNRTKRPPIERQQCGTVAGYRHHVKRGEQACDACREANTAYKRRWRAKKSAAGSSAQRPKSVEQPQPQPKQEPHPQPAPEPVVIREVVIADGEKDVDGYPAFLRDAGRKMWDDLHESYEFDVASEQLLAEACRLKDRLERFAAALSRQSTLWFELGDIEEALSGEKQVNIVINGMISEARQTQAALGVALGKIGVLKAASRKSDGTSMADELKKKREERRKKNAAKSNNGNKGA